MTEVTEMTVSPDRGDGVRSVPEPDGVGNTPESREAVLSVLPPCIGSWPISLHKDQHNQSWARVPVARHREAVQLTSERFRGLLVKRLAGNGVTPTPTIIKLCISVLSALADEALCEVANRSAVGTDPHTVWIDLADKERRAVRVGP